ncbi:CCT domain-containing protein [Tanacetum coccineum]
MYAERGLMFPYFQNLSSDIQQFDDFCHSHKSISTCLDSLIQTSAISDYDLGGEGDLFKAPEPIIEQPLVSLDPMTSAMSMISCGEDAISPQELKVTDIESLQNEEFLNDVFYECKNILANEAATGSESSPFSEVLSFNFPVSTDDQNPVAMDNVTPSCQIPKSMSCDSLSSMDWIQGAQVRPSYLNFGEIDFENAYGMRRAFSEGDIKTLDDANSLIHYPLGQPPLISERTNEDRMQKLSRYRNKKTKRNFGRKIKYACRKALADSQPRIRGRFAKTDEADILRK